MNTNLACLPVEVKHSELIGLADSDNRLMSYGQRLKEAMDALDPPPTREALCKHLGITKSALSQQINDKTKASAENCAKSAKFLKCDMHWLATGEGSRINPAAAWREMAYHVAAAQDIGERGQRYKTFCELVDRLFDLGSAEMKLNNPGGESSKQVEGRHKRSRVNTDH